MEIRRLKEKIKQLESKIRLTKLFNNMIKEMIVDIRRAPLND